jgi:hypothetical protein
MALLDELDARASRPVREHRADPRFSYRQELKLVCCEADEADVQHWIFPRDISERGIGFLHMEPLPLGRRVIVHLVAQNGALHAVAARVAHCREIEDQWFLAGACFDAPIDALHYA